MAITLKQQQQQQLLLLVALVSFAAILQLDVARAFSTVERLAMDELQGNASTKVSVELFFESLCPYSANFIVNFLNKFFSNGLISIVNLRFIPYGNAQITSNGSIICQHGPYECKLNLIETCAINLWPMVTQYFPFVYCVESLVLEHKYESWPTCVESSGLDLAAIMDCFNSPVGLKFQLEFAAETNNLEPPHKYVPWVVVNGKPIYEDYEDVDQYVCEAYLGPKPDSCSSENGSIRLEHTKGNKICLDEPVHASM